MRTCLLHPIRHASLGSHVLSISHRVDFLELLKFGGRGHDVGLENLGTTAHTQGA